MMENEIQGFFMCLLLSNVGEKQWGGLRRKTISGVTSRMPLKDAEEFLSESLY